MKFQIKESERARRIAENMTLRELINQCVCPLRRIGGELDEAEEYGAVFVFAEAKDVLKENISKYKKRCKIEPLIAGDMECGAHGMVLGATGFPSFMACSQADSSELAFEMGRIAAAEGLEVGYNWNFAPVADLVQLADSPVVSLRSAGNTPEQVVKIAGSFMKGIQSNGMAATLKHFPGDGYDIYDQHVTTPVNPLGMEQWRNSSGRCFRELIDEDAMSVMPGHIALPAYDTPDSKTGLYPPATLSKRIMTDLLKGELGFEGLIVSDAINMGGAVNFMNYYEACATFWECGGDILLFVDMKGFHEKMEQLIDEGRLKVETLKNRAYRILCFKDQLGLLDEGKKEIPVDKAYNEEVARKITEASITLVRDRAGLIPYKIKDDTRILHLVIMNDAMEKEKEIRQLTNEIKKYSSCVEELMDPGPGRLFDDVRGNKYDLIICSIGTSIAWGLNVSRLHGPMARNMMNGWMKLGTPVIFVAHAHPFIHKEYAAATDTIINTYGTTEDTAKYLLEGITGQRPLNTRVVAHD